MGQQHLFLVDQVEKKIINYIRKNNIKIGETIPKELEFVKILGVSRTVVREALSRLRAQGLLESKRKKGTILKNPDVAGVLKKSIIPQLMDNAALKDYFEIRLAMEVGMADLIMERKTEQDINELRQILEIENAESPYVFDIVFETEFHGKLYSITRNESMMKFQNMLLPLFEYIHKSGVIKDPDHVANFVSHTQLVDIIEHGNAQMLRTALRDHLDPHYRRIFSARNAEEKISTPALF